jgi:hypothetical protein
MKNNKNQIILQAKKKKENLQYITLSDLFCENTKKGGYGDLREE